ARSLPLFLAPSGWTPATPEIHPAPVRVRHSERLTTRKIRSSFAASPGASSTVDFCGWSGVSLTGAG
ncbi:MULTISPECIES: hypothetical protein, partial [Enterobacteriaceae]|uniref:hypothetical protein n=1 Tax=Enterobacteriaceae TaxID=543 RepID=UPI0019247BC0